MLPSQRHLFDIPDEVAYFNCAYMSPLLRASVSAGERAARRKAQPWRIVPEDFFTESEHARATFARLINASADDVAIVPAASYAMALAARNLPVGRDQTIVVLAEQFPSNYYVWKTLADRAGAALATVKWPPDGQWTPGVLEAIDERTAVVTIANCHWTDGSLVDLEQVSHRCRETGAALVLDLTQSAGAMPFDSGAIQPDFAVAACYKWLLGPYTLGFMYAAPGRQSGRALEHSWIARAGSEDFAGLVTYREELQPGARRYDMGERANFHLLPMAQAALEQILDWGVGEVAATLAARTGQIAERATELGLECLPATHRAAHFLGLRFPRGVPESLPGRLADAGIHVSMRGTSMRVTPHLYNTDEDVERLFSVLGPAL